MNRLEGRVARLERGGGGRNGWRAYAGAPMGQWPDDALLGFLAESQSWPPGHVPTDELRAVASLAAGDGGDGAA